MNAAHEHDLGERVEFQKRSHLKEGRNKVSKLSLEYIGQYNIILAFKSIQTISDMLET